MELGVVRLLVAEARAAGLDPARDPIPGLRRDVLFTCTADEEAGGDAGRGWIAENRPDWLRAAGGLNECGGVSVDRGRPADLPDPGRREGVRRRTGSSSRGTWGHGSMPRDGQRGRARGRVVERLAVPGPIRLTPVMVARSSRRSAAASRRTASPACSGRLRGDDPAARCGARRALRPDVRAGAAGPRPRHDRARTSSTPGVKYNVIPGEAVIEVDCRALPGMTEPAMRAELVRRIGPDLLAAAASSSRSSGATGRIPGRGPAVGHPRRDAARPRPRRPSRCPVMAPFATDAKSHRYRSACRRTGSRRSGWIPTSAILERCSTAWTSASRSTRCAGGCRSCTTCRAASAAEAARPRRPAVALALGRRSPVGRRTRTCSSQVGHA